MNLLDATTAFMKLAHQNIEGGQWDDTDHREFRQALLQEEYNEYMNNGEYDDNLVETVDGLLDTIVIAWGTLLGYIGEDLAKKCAHEVWRSNLSKVDGSLGDVCVRDDGKVLKPPGWQRPKIAAILNEVGMY